MRLNTNRKSDKETSSLSSRPSFSRSSTRLQLVYHQISVLIKLHPERQNQFTCCSHDRYQPLVEEDTKKRMGHS